MSPVLLAMGLGEDVAASAIRVSIGATTSEAELDAFARAYGAIGTPGIAT
jgi:cysteine sulfinate desulfinase/cysteine desulfurase-like protein